MKPFEYFEPRTVGEATQILSNYGAEAQILSGGVDLIPRMQKGDIRAEYVVNIQRIAELADIQSNGKEGITFGATSRLRSLEVSKTLQNKYPILYEAIHQITSVQAKYMGTAVGNLCVATPASDVATSLFALGARLKITGPNGERIEPIEKFYVGYHLTSLKRGEMVTEVLLPNPPSGTGTAFFNLVRTHADIAKISAATAIFVENGICREVRIAIGAAAPTVFRAVKAETLLTGQKITPEVIRNAAETAAGETKPITDLRSTEKYRKEMARVLVRRALEKALENARS
jgi:aerobic carbon-monoxide dehydrogenase medium subunit